jgi:hypothetical protein
MCTDLKPLCNNGCRNDTGRRGDDWRRGDDICASDDGCRNDNGRRGHDPAKPLRIRTQTTGIRDRLIKVQMKRMEAKVTYYGLSADTISCYSLERLLKQPNVKDSGLTSQASQISLSTSDSMYLRLMIGEWVKFNFHTARPYVCLDVCCAKLGHYT